MMCKYGDTLSFACLHANMRRAAAGGGGGVEKPRSTICGRSNTFAFVSIRFFCQLLNLGRKVACVLVANVAAFGLNNLPVQRFSSCGSGPTWWVVIRFLVGSAEPPMKNTGYGKIRQRMAASPEATENSGVC